NVYRTLKKDCKLAPYLIQIKNYKQRILLTKYRLSDHSLAVEKGRHRQCWLAPEGRLCVHCNINAVENEPHFLTECTKYHNIRNAYYKQFEYIHPGFINLTNQQNLRFLLGKIETCNILASEYVQSCHILREQAITPINIGLNSVFLKKKNFFFLYLFLSVYVFSLRNYYNCNVFYLSFFILCIFLLFN